MAATPSELPAVTGNPVFGRREIGGGALTKRHGRW